MSVSNSIESADRSIKDSVINVEMSIEGTTGKIIASYIKNNNGRYTTKIGVNILTLRMHLGITLGEIFDIPHVIFTAREHCLKLNNCSIPVILLERNGLRFLNYEQSIIQIKNRIILLKNRFIDEFEWDIVEKTIEILEKERLRCKNIIVHGDMSISNFILHEGELCVIDHDTIHIDYELYDIAHLILSFCCTRYFRGELNIERYLISIDSASKEYDIAINHIVIATKYALLKKFALVRKDINLHISERIQILKDIQKIDKLF